MARFKEVPYVLRTVGLFTFAKRIWQQINEDNVFTWASALAYSWLFAIFPFLICLLALVSHIPQQWKPQAQAQIRQWADEVVPSSDAAKLISDQINLLLDPKKSTGGFLSFGLILSLWAASGGIAMTMTALDKAYDIEKGRSFIRQRLMAAFLTFTVATLTIVVLILLPLGTGVLTWLAHHGKVFGWVLVLVNVARYAIALLLLIVITSLIYHFGPNLKHKYQAVSPGAIFAIAVWLILGFAFKLYITKFGGQASYSKTYGAVAGLVILLLFFYVDAMVLLIGAEINSEIDFAVVGLPSGKTAEQQVVAPVPTPENLALKTELKELREETAQKIAEDKSGGETTGPSTEGNDKTE